MKFKHSLCKLSLAPIVINSVAADSSEVLAAVVFIVNVVCHVLQVVHVGPGKLKKKNFFLKVVQTSVDIGRVWLIAYDFFFLTLL